MNKTVIILFNEITNSSSQDEIDVLEQAEIVFKSLTELGYKPEKMTFSIDIKQTIEKISAFNPLFIFNLVESIESNNEMISLAPLLFNHLRIPYTGAPLDAMFVTTNKVLTKKILKLSEINTANWFMLNELDLLEKNERYIIKPISEDGSVKLDEDSVFSGNDEEYIERIKTYDASYYFVEQYIDGREFNLSVLGGKLEPEVMPPAEIQFVDYPPEKNKVVGYKAKWIEDSFEYTNTPRTFDFPESDTPLLEKLKRMARRCWNEFGMKGYSRVDFRVDKNGEPFVMEINANPCIADYSGFPAAVKQGGYDYRAMIERIVADAIMK